MKRTARRALLSAVCAGCCCAVAQATSPDRTVEQELRSLVGVLRQWTERRFQDEGAFFAALIEIIPPSGERGRLSVLDRLTGPGFERRFYFGPAGPRQGPGPSDRALAVTSFAAWRNAIAFCADTTPLVCVRRDGFEPRVRAGKCDDPRCEVFARGEQVQRAGELFSQRR